MSSRHIVVCDLCEREVRMGMPTDKSVPEVRVIHMHTYEGFNMALDLCRECAEQKAADIDSEKLS